MVFVKDWSSHLLYCSCHLRTIFLTMPAPFIQADSKTWFHSEFYTSLFTSKRLLPSTVQQKPWQLREKYRIWTNLFSHLLMDSIQWLCKCVWFYCSTSMLLSMRNWLLKWISSTDSPASAFQHIFLNFSHHCVHITSGCINLGGTWKSTEMHGKAIAHPLGFDNAPNNMTTGRYHS